MLEFPAMEFSECNADPKIVDFVKFVGTRFEPGIHITFKHFQKGCAHFSGRILNSTWRQIRHKEEIIRVCFKICVNNDIEYIQIPVKKLKIPDPRSFISNPQRFTKCLPKPVENVRVWISNDVSKINEILENLFFQENILGFDIEWPPVFVKKMISKPAMLQIATESECLLIRICQLGKRLPKNLIQILQNPKIKKVGRGILNDQNIMNKEYQNLNMKGAQEIKGTMGLKNQANKYLNMNFNKNKMKKTAMSDWERKNCNLKMLEYAAMDAIISRKLFMKLGGQCSTARKKKKKIKKRKVDAKLEIYGRQGPNEIVNGIYTKSKDMHSGKVCYEKTEPDDVYVCLRWHDAGVWLLSEHRDFTLNGYACVQDNSDLPLNIQNVWNLYDGGYIADQNIKIKKVISETTMPKCDETNTLEPEKMIELDQLEQHEEEKLFSKKEEEVFFDSLVTTKQEGTTLEKQNHHNDNNNKPIVITEGKLISVKKSLHYYQNAIDDINSNTIDGTGDVTNL